MRTLRSKVITSMVITGAILLTGAAAPAQALCLVEAPSCEGEPPVLGQPPSVEPQPDDAPAPDEPAPPPEAGEPESHSETAPSPEPEPRAAFERDREAERRLTSLVSASRQAAGLAGVSARDDIADVAATHSNRMAERGDIFHNDQLFSKKTKARLGARAVAENVAYNDSVEAAHQRLMASPGHRANILDGRFDVVGVGVVRAANGWLYVTEVFVDPIRGGGRVDTQRASRSEPASPPVTPPNATPSPSPGGAGDAPPETDPSADPAGAGAAVPTPRSASADSTAAVPRPLVAGIAGGALPLVGVAEWLRRRRTHLRPSLAG